MARSRARRALRRIAPGAAIVVGLAATTACTPSHASGPAGIVKAVAAEIQYANVVSQIGGRYVQATAVEDNPNIDPHSFEASPRVANEISQAQLVVQNGLGYDAFMDRVESASSGSGRTVIDVQKLLGLPDSTPNPHLWYEPATMPAVAKAVGAALSKLQPSHAQYFSANVAKFDTSLRPWLREIARVSSTYPNAPVATTEPVANGMLQAAGLDIKTPPSLQAAIMNGTDPSPQDVATQRALFTGRQVELFVYNRQVTDSITQTFLSSARANGIPVVGVYETMPTSSASYQSWMLAATTAVFDALHAATGTTGP